MIKNVLMVMLACFVFMLAGCGDNGSVDTSYINVPVKYFDQVIANVSDDKNWPFEGATIVLTHANGTEYPFELDDNIECDFGKLPYGQYAVEIPGYSETVRTIVIDADYTPADLVFTRLTVGITVEVKEYAGNVAELRVFVSDGFNDFVQLDFNQPGTFFEKTVPAGRYYLTALGANDLPVAYATIDVNLNSYEFTLTAEENIRYAVFHIPVEQYTRVQATLADNKPNWVYWNEAYTSYTAFFVLENAGSYRLNVTADGFDYFSENFDIGVGQTFVPMITPIGQAKTVAIYDFVVCENGTPLSPTLDVEMVLGANDDEPDSVFYIAGKYMNQSAYTGVYVMRYYLSQATDTSLPYKITAPGYQDYSWGIIVNSGFRKEIAALARL